MKKAGFLLLGLAALATCATAADEMGNMKMGGPAAVVGSPAPTASSPPKPAKKAKAKNKKALARKAAKPAVAKEGAAKASETAAAPAKKHKWICPMDGTESGHPGACPKCGMEMVEKK